MIFTKGAPLEVAAECDYYHQEKEVREITDEIRSEIVAANDTIAGDGFRVLAVSCQILEPAPARRIFLGLTAMADPPRPEVYEAVKQCAKAGIKVTIITGDYGITAASIARQVGLIDRGFLSITGPELDGKTDEALEQLLQHRQPIIFSRTTPEHKLRIVEAYKRIGEIVAVTGDGVNDTLALKASHVGIAMGIGGTDVAREVSDMVLLDNNFATIIRAVEEGRAVYSNIRKFLTYIMTSNVAEFAPFFAMLFIKIPPALNILQILAIDLGTDILPALALGAERPEKGILSEQPERFRKNLLDKSLFLRSYGFLGLIEGALAIGFFLYTWFNAGYNLSELRFLTDVILANRAPADLSSLYQYSTTMALAAIIASQIGNVYVCRSERLSIRDTIAGKNHLIAVGIGFELLLAMAIIYLPALQEIFDTQAIAAADLKILMICPLIMIGLEELRKYISAR